MTLVYLIGLKGVGKSTCARRFVTHHRHWHFKDSDDLLLNHPNAQINGQPATSIRELYQAVGEARYRELEYAVISGLQQTNTPTIVATGGGCVLHPDTRAHLRNHGRVVWLDIAEQAWRQRPDLRLPPQPHHDDNLNPLGYYYHHRAPHYARTAHHRVDVTGLTPDAVCEALTHHLNSPYYLDEHSLPIAFIA